MRKSEVLHDWGTILSGRAPSLSIEITKECPLHCPAGTHSAWAISGALRSSGNF
jgi:hypothetical protein